MDQMPPGLKIHNRTGHLLFDSSWIAGVDYINNFNEQQAEDQDEDYEPEQEEEEDYEEEDLESFDEQELNDLNSLNNESDNENETEETENQEEEEQEPDEIQETITDTNNETNEQDNNKPESHQAMNTSNPSIRRSNRIHKPNPRYMHLQANTSQTEEYSSTSARIIAMTMCHLNNTMKGISDDQAFNFIQTYSLKQGIKKFGMKGRNAAFKEMKQIHDRVVFIPINVNNMTDQERKRAMESLIFLSEKRDGTIKARTCANGSTQRDYINKDEPTSPTASTEAILITGVIDAKQRRDVMTLDVPNAFVQTAVPQDKEKIIMKIRGELVDILVEVAPEVYKDYVIYEGNHKILYVQMMKALYGMLISSILYYKKFRSDIESIGFKVNPYDICVANRMVNGKQHTVTWHVDDLKSSHVDPKVNDEFHEWCKKMYASDNIGQVKVVRGKKHDYLAMILDYSEDGKLKVDMKYYIEDMLNQFPEEIKSTKSVPWSDKLFNVTTTSPALNNKMRETFHTFVMKAMFLCKRGRPDINPAIAFLASRVKKPNQNDWDKLKRVLQCLKGTKEDILTLEADNTQTLTWYVDAAFAVHCDMKSHTGAIFTIGKGAIISDSTKQKNNSRSSTEAELNAVDEKLSKILWSKKFIEAQGFPVKINVIYQDNTSTMKLQQNGKASSGKRTRHFDIKMFYITDLIDKKEVEVQYCPTDHMIADYMTKPLTGTKFKQFRQNIMNCEATT